MRRLVAGSKNFSHDIESLRSFDLLDDEVLDKKVSQVLMNVRRKGDSALLDYINEFESQDLKAVLDSRVDMGTLASSWDRLSTSEQDVLTLAINRVESFHRHQIESSWSYVDEQENRLGQQVTPIKRVGVYVPGGRASYPSTTLMTVIPAQVAGVSEIAVVTPVGESNQNDFLFGALYKLGIEEVYGFGGAQAIAALAFGTESIPKVDKIVGPGGLYVTAAKRKVFGYVGIDSIAGPTELVVIADNSAPIDWVVLDLLSQAEHDPSAQSLLISADSEYTDSVLKRIDEVLPSFSREQIIRQSLESRGAAIEVVDLDQAIEISNVIAPEHLQLCVKAPRELLPKVSNAGAIFCGNYASEAFGDYLAGPSHVLPTFGSSRFSSPLGVYDFVKKSSLVEMSKVGAMSLSKPAFLFAKSEGLEAHALASKARGEDLGSNIFEFDCKVD